MTFSNLSALRIKSEAARVVPRGAGTVNCVSVPRDAAAR